MHGHTKITLVYLKAACMATTQVSCVLDLHSTTQVVSRLHTTVLGKSCVVEIGLNYRSTIEVHHSHQSSNLY